MKILGENNCSLGVARLRQGFGEVFDIRAQASPLTTKSDNFGMVTFRVSALGFRTAADQNAALQELVEGLEHRSAELTAEASKRRAPY